MLIRLNKFLSESGCCSRRKADEYIASGDIKINGKVTKELGIKIDPEKDAVEFQDKEVKIATDFLYYALYKPKGIVSTVSDELGRKTVIDLVPETPRVYPVGRLDTDSEGLIILTSDGDLTQRMTHPSFEHEKEYLVNAKFQISNSKRVAPEIIKSQFEKGLYIDGHLMKADKTEVSLVQSTGFIILTLVLHTGYNRQVRKMCAKIGLDVIKLVRTRFGKLKLSDLELAPGEYRLVTRADIL